tara:strand:+ start:641 stop:1084 length:444 start_codon:yes stop_codon:yes gene_type:complete
MSINVRENHLFVEEDFIGHSGGELHWKIECDALFPNEWKCIAKMIMEHEKRPFQAAIGIPRGGITLSKYLNEYSTQNPEDPYLIVDDVLTTGGSMNYFVEQYFRNREPNEYFGWVVFSRKSPASWIKALFQMPKTWVDDPTKPEYNK